MILKRVLWAIVIRMKIFYYKFFAKKIYIDKTLRFRSGFHILVDGKGRIEIGKNCFFNNYCSINSMLKVQIGNDCIFGENVKIYDHSHRFMEPDKLIREQGFTFGEVVIADNVWVCSNVIILQNTHIGSGSVIAAGAVVKGDIPSNSIVKRNGEIVSIKYQ